MNYVNIKEMLMKKIEGINNEKTLWIIWDFVKGLIK